MGAYDAAPPLVLGSYSLTSGVTAVIIIHALACMFVISTASSVVEFQIGNMNVSTDLQIFAASWCVLGIAILVGAWLSIQAKQEWPMRVYFYYSLLTVIFISVALVLVVADSNHCDLVSNDHTAQRVGADFACGLVSFLLFAVVLAVLAIFMYMTHIVWQMKELLGQRETSQTFVLDDRLVESKMHQQSMGGKGHADYGAGSARAGHLGMDGSGAAGRYGEGADGERAERGAGGFGLSGGKLDGMLGLDEDEPTGMLESMGLAGGCSGATAAGGPSGAGSSYQGGRGRGGLDASGRPLDFHGASGRFTATGRPEHPEWAVAPSGPQPGWGQIPIRSKEEPQ